MKTALKKIYLLTVIRFWKEQKKKRKDLRILVRLKGMYLGCSHKRHHPLQTSFYSVSYDDARMSSSPNKCHRVRSGIFASDKLIALEGCYLLPPPSAIIVSDNDMRTLVARAHHALFPSKEKCMIRKNKGGNKNY